MAILAGIGKRIHVLEWRGWFRNQNARPDVVHVHADTWEGALSASAGVRWRCPVFIKPTVYPLRLEVAPVPFAGAGQRTAFDSVRYFALTSEIHDALREKGVEETRIIDVPNGVEIPLVPSNAERKPIVLMVGNLTQGTYHKAFDVMLEAWSRVGRTHPSAALWVAGAGDPSPWQAMADQLGCANSVRFLGRVHDVGPLYDEAQVFCLPSREEGISNALLEAQSRGVACVVSDIRANRAVVTHGKNGWVVPVGDPEALASAVQKLLDDAPKRVQLGQNAVRRVAAEFEIGTIVSRLETAYRAAIEALIR
jgi:glycosyltransferase involved in cell wall biosynthesis